ncbi:MAG TPA: tetratricopeptide repeat protein [Sphingobacteriaceae bacterium]
MKKSYLSLLIIFAFFATSAQEATKEANDALLLDLFQNQRFGEASDYLKSVYPEPITDKKILARFGYSLLMAGRLGEAETYYNRILEQDSTDIPVLFSMAGISQRKGNYPKATGYYKRIIAIDSTNFSVYKQLSSMIGSTESLLAAGPYLIKANQLNPRDGDIAYDLSKVLKAGKQLALAEAVLDTAIAADSSNLILLRGKAELAHAAKKWPVAISIAEKILAQGDSSAQVLILLGESCFQIKNYDKSVEIFSGLEKRTLQSESILYFLAMSYKARNDQAKAIEYFYKTIDESISPNVAGYYALLGDTYEKSKAIRKALNAYQRSLQFEEKPMTLYAIASIYDRQLKDHRNALKYYKRYLSSKPEKAYKTYTEYTTARIAELSR